MNKPITLTDQEIGIIRALGDAVYTPEYIQEWINREDNVFSNAPAALAAMGAKGYYEAVHRMAENISAGRTDGIFCPYPGKACAK